MPDTTRARYQINLRLPEPSVRELEELRAVTRETVSELVRRLIHEEHDKRGLAVAVPPVASKEE